MSKRRCLTLSDVCNMTDEQLLIKVATLAGWKHVKPWTVLNHGKFFGLSPEGHTGAEVPDYTGSRAAMRRLWLQLDGTQQEDFAWKMLQVLNIKSKFGYITTQQYDDMARATARQRAEAYVLTLTKQPAKLPSMRTKITLKAANEAIDKAAHLAWGIQIGSPLFDEKLKEIKDNLAKKGR
jgi:hypothetical protein